jgi:pyruvate ferredoxin oxidoreductase beta subunit
MANDELPKNIRGLPVEEYFVNGHLACASCGAAIIMRLITKAAGPNTILVSATGCMEVVSSKYPTTAWKLPWAHGAFENAAPIASGIDAALKMQGKRDKYNIMVIAGDGSTYDIGFGALSAALERGDKFTYVCYDNESYANTGNQRSGATPYHAWTTTTPIGTRIKGKQEEKKPLVEIIAAHNIPYVATASLSHPNDLVAKIKKSFTFDGPAFINILSPCILGWKHAPNMPIELSRRAVDSGMWLLYEIEHGKFKLNYEPKMIPVKDYLKEQARFKHLTEDDIQHIQQQVQHNYSELKKHLESEKHG